MATADQIARGFLQISMVQHWGSIWMGCQYPLFIPSPTFRRHGISNFSGSMVVRMHRLPGIMNGIPVELAGEKAEFLTGQLISGFMLPPSSGT
jgi:hypothetical protein